MILPFWAIDPVLSSARATRIFTLPHVAVELASKGRVGKPANFMKSVVMLPLLVTRTFEVVLPLPAVYVALIGFVAAPLGA